MPSSREIAATNAFFRKTGIHHAKIAIGPGSTAGVPDRLALLPNGFPLLIEFKEGRIVEHPEFGPMISFSQKHGLKGTQVNWFRAWLRYGGDAGLMVSVPVYGEWKSNRSRPVDHDRYFYRHNPPNYFLRRLQREGGLIGEFMEVSPLTSDGFLEVLERHKVKRKAMMDDPLVQEMLLRHAERSNDG